MTPPTKVLLVEDDILSSQHYKKMLSTRGYTIFPPVTNGSDAIRAAREHAPDLVIMDVNLEGEIDGVETATRLKSEFHVPVIYATGSAETETIERAKNTASAYLLKPFNRRDLLIAIDVALAKHEMETRLRESETRLSTILSSIANGVIAVDPSGSISYFNDTAEIVTGIIRERALGTPLADLYDICDLESGERLESYFAALQKLDRPFNIPKALLVGDSETSRIVSIQISPITSDHGTYQGLVCVLIDITDQIESDEQLRTLGQALESIRDSVLITDTELDENGEGPTILYANRAFEKSFGFAPDAILYQNINRVYGAETNPRFQSDLKNALRHRSHFSGETRLHIASGEPISIELQLAPVDDGHGNISKFVVTLRDVTHLRHLEENIRQSQKIEAVGRLAAGIAHDFNNLLSVINSYSDILMARVGSSDPSYKHLEQIFLAGRKGSDLVSKLMAFSRREDSAVQQIDLCEVLKSVEGILSRVVREDINLNVSINTDRAPTLADRSSVEQAIVNMVVNARDAIPTVGSISITLDAIKVTENSRSGEFTGPPGRYLKLRIEDTGMGIDPASLRKIFEPFFTTKDVGKGTGLGLSLVYTLMKRIGGDITVDSTLGVGTTFDLYFPEVEHPQIIETDSETENFDLKAYQAPDHNQKILIVEDDPIFGECITNLLALRGYDVALAHNGQDAIDRYSGIFNQLSLIITDVVMPKMSGIELVRRILLQNPQLRVVFMTGYDEGFEKEYSLPEGATVMQKPVSLKRIIDIVASGLEAQA